MEVEIDARAADEMLRVVAVRAEHVLGYLEGWSSRDNLQPASAYTASKLLQRVAKVVRKTFAALWPAQSIHSRGLRDAHSQDKFLSNIMLASCTASLW